MLTNQPIFTLRHHPPTHPPWKDLELCSMLINLFHLSPLATAKYVSLLLELVVRTERALHIEPTSPLRAPLVRFLARYPAETCAHLLSGALWPYDAHAHRIFLVRPLPMCGHRGCLYAYPVLRGVRI